MGLTCYVTYLGIPVENITNSIDGTRFGLIRLNVDNLTNFSMMWTLYAKPRDGTSGNISLVRIT